MVLFATDIAARGLDFPTVDWVVQVRWDWFTLRVQQCLPCNCSLWAAALCGAASRIHPLHIPQSAQTAHPQPPDSASRSAHHLMPG